MKKKEPVIETNHALLNVIAPIGLEFQRNSLRIGENIAKGYGIVKYPVEAEYGWLSKLTNISSTLVTISFNPLDPSGFLEAVNKNISVQRGKEQSSRDTLTRQRAQKAAEDGEAILEKIDQTGERVGEIGIVIMPIAEDDNYFKRVQRKVESTCALLKCKPRVLANLQEQSFKQLSPFYTTNGEASQIISRIIPLSTLIGGFPFSASGYSDLIGCYFAKDVSGGLILLDLWKRGADRTNSNLVIMGMPGQGKSAAVKHIALGEYALGTKLIFIDPEREYRDLCHNLNGDWINAGGGSEGKINPLEIRPIPRDDEDTTYKDEGHGMGDMALYIKHLEIFFSLYLPSLDDMDKAYLKESLIEVYNNFNIFWDTNVIELDAKDFPIISDLYSLLLGKGNAFEKSRRDIDQNVYQRLSMLLKDAAHGADQSLWNGHTEIKTKSRCICLDTHDLQDTSDNVKRTQYFNLLSWAWKEMSKDRTEKILLICDEAYLMIDPNVPQSLVFLRNASKRDRKYEGAIALISHSVVDFLDPSVKMYGQALLDNPTYKIIMGTNGKNLQETDSLYNLTEIEKELLESQQRGHALFLIGSKRMHINFEIDETKWEYFGSAGGR